MERLGHARLKDVKRRHDSPCNHIESHQEYWTTAETCNDETFQPTERDGIWWPTPRWNVAFETHRGNYRRASSPTQQIESNHAHTNGRTTNDRRSAASNVQKASATGQVQNDKWQVIYHKSYPLSYYWRANSIRWCLYMHLHIFVCCYLIRKPATLHFWAFTLLGQNKIASRKLTISNLFCCLLAKLICRQVFSSVGQSICVIHANHYSKLYDIEFCPKVKI